MKKITLLFFILAGSVFAQPPAGYYDTANGLTGFDLKTELKQIISNGYSGQSYNALLGLYETSDNDDYFDGGTQTNTILDIYSENPGGADPYNYFFNENCGNVGPEGTCYNREHLFPQGFFNQLEPMRSDAHHVVPTDGQVNGRRSNFPFGEVGTPTFVSENGSRLGNSVTPGYTDTVFEPIDEFKGDIARSLLYFATRYEDSFDDSGWDSPSATNDPRDGSQSQWYEDWYIDLLLKWHQQDPVSAREVERNNEIFAHQNNRNPFIDRPEYVNRIWGPAAMEFALSAQLTGTYVDTNNDNIVNIGDEVIYEYEITNIGTETIFNIDGSPEKGSFETPRQLDALNTGVTSTTPFGFLRYNITQQDLDSGCKCVSNFILFTGNSSQINDGEIVEALTDDPNDNTNVDTDNDNYPDDPTVVTLPIQGSGVNASDLFISEYIEGSSNNKAIEIANFTGNTIDLSNYALQRDTNGGGNWQDLLTLLGDLPNGEVFVIARSQADAVIRDKADILVNSGTALDFNGNDPVGLFKNGNLIDIVGDFGGGSTDFAADVTLVRKSTVTSPSVTFLRDAEWNEFPQNNSVDLGQHTFGSTASIDEDFFAQVRVYPNPSSGLVYINGLDIDAAVTVYDLAGRIIQKSNLNSDQIQIDSSGMYLLELKTKNSKKTFKIIIH